MSEFFAMGGYGLYVWGSFGMSALLMLAEPLLIKKQHGAILIRLRRMARQKSARQNRDQQGDQG